jgi:hypothetical protein
VHGGAAVDADGVRHTLHLAVASTGSRSGRSPPVLVRLGDGYGVGGVEFDDRGCCTLGHVALGVGMDRVVGGRNDRPRRQRVPCGGAGDD